ncbi:mitochondrial 3-hydroxyisobutyryl-CoA hydrolase-like protein [Calycina marina]|uniref:3-hydroxyisobutyryl-CoA hydrolase n=1 Tax=Calycina marina TaxID=1763456 RepID=A0A9P8CEH6_9HELO|nr:mitochondrial 3-hydroxyisobutyryl-CoA hydrolase-like protein [Calycina marina]
MFARSISSRSRTALRSSTARRTMPLRAKVTNPLAVRSIMEMPLSRAAGEVTRELPEDPKEDVLFDTLYGVRTIELNRPKALHSLNGSMVRKIVPRLQEWEKSDMANVVVIKATGEKAFCAGGDVSALAKDNMQGEEGQQRSTDYFGLEYKLDHLIARYSKPFVAFMDGITMGGGVGLSIHAPFRIATERTLFAMPETTIGFFPDVGASFFLPRMPGAVGTYLAMTSDRLKGANVFYSGVATHYIHSSTLPALERRFAELRFRDYDTLADRLALVNATIEEYVTGLPHDETILLGGNLRNAIDRCFSKNTVNEIMAALEAEEGDTTEWAQKTLKTLHQRSPTAVHVTLRTMQLGKKWNIEETFQREYEIAGKFMRHPDFTEGVDALLIRKDKSPKWQPASLEDIKPEESKEIVDPFLQVEGNQKLKMLAPGDFKEYPWQRFGIPREEDVGRIWLAGGRSREAVTAVFVQKYHGKQGIQAVVMEMLKRRGKKEKDGSPLWLDVTKPAKASLPTELAYPKMMEVRDSEKSPKEEAFSSGEATEALEIGDAHAVTAQESQEPSESKE